MMLCRVQQTTSESYARAHRCVFCVSAFGVVDGVHVLKIMSQLMCMFMFILRRAAR